MKRALTTLLLGCCLVLAARPALAARVLLIRPVAADTTLSEAFNRLRAELMLQDFEVLVLDGQRQLSPDELQQAAQQHDAFAGVALNRHGNGTDADVCVADRVTGKISLRRLAIAAGQDSPRVLAVRAVDLLRESLRELPAGQRPPADVVGVTPAPASPVVRAFAERARFDVGVFGVALTTPRSISNGYGAGLELGYRPTPRLALVLWFVGPVLGARYQSVNGAANLQQELTELRVAFSLLRSGRLALGPGLGAGAYHLAARGEVAAPFSSRSASLWSFASTCGLGGWLQLGESVWLSATLDGLLLVPRPAVAVDDATEELGRPLLLAALGLGVAF